MFHIKLSSILLTTASVLLFTTTVAQQQTEPCLFDRQYQLHKKTYDAANQLLLSAKKSNGTSLKDGALHIIPVVVHVIHNGGSENISDAQINSQITALNEDYGKAFGTKGDGEGVDTKVRFSLAKITPNGRCTNGIVRIKSTLSDHKTVDRQKLKELSFWDNKRYLNIYVVKSIDNGSGTLGYSSFPNGPDESDGIVVLHRAFGRIGTAVAPNNLGRTITHEIGHWFGLYHTFQDGCGTDTCTTGDFICDTPPVANPNYGCPNNKNSCSNDNLPDQISNYMDYSDDGCKSMFSAGQAERMNSTLNTLRSIISSAENVTATGCDSGFVNGPCSVIADFVANSRTVCTGNSVLFVNKSLNGAKAFKWSFPGGVPDTASALNPSVQYNTPGTYTATLIAFDSLTADTLSFTNYITVANPPTGLPLPYYEGFENNTFPSNGIIIENADEGITWLRDTIAVAYNGKASAKINNLINTNYGQADALVLPGFDLQSYPTTPYLRFRWAYARSDANYSDQLSVLISTDCGVNYTQIFTRTGAGLATGPTQTTPYIPDSSTIWKEAKINLNAYKDSPNALLKIVNVTDGGNNLYVDDIRLNDLSTGIEQLSADEATFSIYPNPAESQISIEFAKGLPQDFTILNAVGQIQTTATNSKTSQSVFINVSDWPAGLYFIKTQNGTAKFLITR